MKIENKTDFDCDTCVLGKMTQEIRRMPDKRARSPLELVHCYLAGPITPIARDGFRYAVCFVDDYSRTCVYFIRNKNDPVRAAEFFFVDISQLGKIKCFRCDNGTEFTSDSFRSLTY